VEEAKDCAGFKSGRRVAGVAERPQGAAGRALTLQPPRFGGGSVSCGRHVRVRTRAHAAQGRELCFFHARSNSERRRGGGIRETGAGGRGSARAMRMRV
jgi:hypothetical protein